MEIGLDLGGNCVVWCSHCGVILSNTPIEVRSFMFPGNSLKTHVSTVRKGILVWKNAILTKRLLVVNILTFRQVDEIVT